MTCRACTSASSLRNGAWLAAIASFLTAERALAGLTTAGSSFRNTITGVVTPAERLAAWAAVSRRAAAGLVAWLAWLAVAACAVVLAVAGALASAVPAGARAMIKADPPTRATAVLRCMLSPMLTRQPVPGRDKDTV